MNQIQSVIFPDPSLCSEEELYYRSNSSAVYIPDLKSIKVSAQAKIKFDTYYNGLTVSVWKKLCKVDDLSLSLKGNGKFLLRIGLHSIARATQWLLTKEVQLDRITESVFELSEWPSLDSGILFFELTAISDMAEFIGGGWATRSIPVNDVKLGVVITHFNRKDYVVPAIQRINDQLLSDPIYAGRIELIVVDNSRNITPDEGGGAIVLPNKNFGGSGGFTRGFMYLFKGKYTHCLFMDDDASCEIESIRRAFNILTYSISEKLAIAGSLLRDIEPYRLFEKGAKFDGMCRPLKSGLDMRAVNDLLLAEVRDQKPDYGGWWFFAFKISDVEKLAFPFFVRGDDIMFSMVNKFNIVTMNGISCWGEDFGLKSGPLPIYLDVRNHLVQQLTHMNSSLINIFKTTIKFFFASAFSYNYATAEAVIQAVNDVIKGPVFWIENIDASEVRRKISALEPTEKLIPIDRSDYNVTCGSPKESNGRKLLRVVTLNGFLIPGCMLKDQVVFQHKGFRASLREIFRYRHILYEYEPLNIGYLASFNRKIFFSRLIEFIKSLFKLTVNFRKLKKEYNQGVEELTSWKFWEKIYSEEK